MGCSGGGGQTSTVTQTTQPPADFLAAYRALQNRATGVASQPLQQYQGPMVAGFTPAQLQAFDTVNSSQGVGAPFTNAAAQYGAAAATPVADQMPLLSDSSNAALAGTGLSTYTSPTPNYWQSAMAALPMLLAATGLGGPAYAGTGQPGVGSPPGITGTANPGVGSGGFGAANPGVIPDVTNGLVPDVNASTIGAFQNPYTEDVVNSTLANIDRSNAIQRNDLTGNAIASGAWGGDRAGVAQAELDRTQGLARGQTEAQLRSSGYAQALAAAQAQQQTGVQKAGLGISQQQIGLGQSGQALQGLGLATNANQAMDQASLARANAAMAAYGQQLSAAQQAAGTTGQLNLGVGQLMGNLGSSAQAQALSGASSQLQTGALQQQLAQEQLNIPYQMFQQMQNYPFYSTNFLGQMTGLAGAGAGDTTTKTSPGPNMMSQLGGLGMAGLGGTGQSGAFGANGWLGSLFGSGAGAGAGAAGSGAGWVGSAEQLTQMGLQARGGRVGREGVGSDFALGGTVGGDAGVGGDVSILRRPEGAARTPIVAPQLSLRPPVPISSGTPGSSLSIDPVSNWSPPAAATPTAPQVAGVGGDVSFNPGDPSTYQSGVGGIGGDTPGMIAARGTVLQQHQSGGMAKGAAAGALAGSHFGPWGAAIGGALGGLTGVLSRTNNTPLQDIRQAIELGRPISDASWAQAGYGPNGTTLSANAGVGGVTPGPNQGTFLPNGDFMPNGAQAPGLVIPADQLAAVWGGAPIRHSPRMGYASGGVGYNDDEYTIDALGLPAVANIAPFDITLNGSPVPRRRPHGDIGEDQSGVAPDASMQTSPNEGLGLGFQPNTTAATGASPSGAQGNAFLDSPWAALTNFGLATMAGESPYALTNIGQGGLYAMQGLERQQAQREARGDRQQEFKLKLADANERARQIDATIDHYVNQDREAAAAREDAAAGKWSHSAQVDDTGHYIETNDKSGEVRQGALAGETPGTKELRQIQRDKDKAEQANKPFNADGTPNKAYQEYELDKTRAGREPITPFDNPVEVEVNDGMGGTTQLLAQQNKTTGEWVTADQSRTPLDPKGLRVVKSDQTGGGRFAGQVLRLLNSAKQATSEIKNIAALPISSSSGPLAGRGQERGLFNAAKEALVNSVQPQEIQDFNVSMIGMGRALSGLESGGMQPNQALQQQFEGLALKEGDTYITKMRKMATMKQDAVNALETTLTSPLLGKEQKEFAAKLIAELNEAIPWNPADVTALEHSKNPRTTIMDVAKKAGLVGAKGSSAAAGVLTVPPAPNERVVGKVYDTPKGKMTWTGQGWEPVQ